ncbi:MAG TPA: ABC transporter permease [Bryobacteraceae bacterium]|jgi:putative ABC transport system permease protein|nr:ABC transporter permease [Bryobacteraceae bacterium]
MPSFFDDLRYAARTLRKSPGFTAVALLTLALAIGATTSVFTVVNAVLLRELPYRNGSSLVLLWTTEQRHSASSERSQVSFPDVQDWRKLNHSFEDIAAYAAWDEVVTGHGAAERISTLRVSPGFFGVMGPQPLLGRGFEANENLNAKASVAVLSYGLWQRKFAQDPNILGKTFSLNSTTFSIIGVMPRDFRSLPASLVETPVELYQPLSKDYLDEIPSGRHLRAIGRLKPGVSLQSAQAEFDVLARQLEHQYPDYNTGRGVRLVKMQDDLVRNLRTGLLVLQVAVSLVVLIACANLANLLLSRCTVRRREIAIRAAVGAGRGRLIRQMLTESLLLGALGGAAGLLLAVWGVHILEAIGTKVIPELTDVSIDLRVLSFTAAISLLSGVVFGMAPATQMSIGSLVDALRAGGRSTPDTAGRRTFRDFLVVSEIALALVLLISAGLLMNSFRHLRAVQPGFNATNVLTADVSMPVAKYARAEQRARFMRDVLNQLRQLPGVRYASAVSVLPESSNFNQMSMDIQGRVFSQGDKPSLDQYDVTPDYFQELSIPLIEGRLFLDQDDRNHINVALINQTAARRLWPGQNPIGARVHTGADNEPWRTIVGVVGDVYQYGLDSQKTMQLYYPYEQDAAYDMTFLLNVGQTLSSANPALGSSLRQAVFAVDKDQPVSAIEPLDQVVSDSIAARRFSMLLLALFASGALALAAVGIYGVISYSVTQRTNEFGIRLALGAQSQDVLALVVRQSMLLIVIGTGIGLAASYAITRLLSSMLFGVSATDLPTFASVSLLLIGVALLASFIPARRATKVDPIVALRWE